MVESETADPAIPIQPIGRQTGKNPVAEDNCRLEELVAEQRQMDVAEAATQYRLEQEPAEMRRLEEEAAETRIFKKEAAATAAKAASAQKQDVRSEP